MSGHILTILYFSIIQKYKNHFSLFCDIVSVAPVMSFFPYSLWTFFHSPVFDLNIMHPKMCQSFSEQFHAYFFLSSSQSLWLYPWGGAWHRQLQLLDLWANQSWHFVILLKRVKFSSANIISSFHDTRCLVPTWWSERFNYKNLFLAYFQNLPRVLIRMSHKSSQIINLVQAGH